MEEDCLLSASLLQRAAAPRGMDDCEAGTEAAAGSSTHVSSPSCNGVQGAAHSSKLQQTLEMVHEVLLPVVILLVGVGFSVAALYVALLPLMQQRTSSRQPLHAALVLG